MDQTIGMRKEETAGPSGLAPGSRRLTLVSILSSALIIAASRRATEAGNEKTSEPESECEKLVPALPLCSLLPRTVPSEQVRTNVSDQSSDKVDGCQDRERVEGRDWQCSAFVGHFFPTSCFVCYNSIVAHREPVW